MNTTITSENNSRQGNKPRYCPTVTNPLKGAMVANGSLKIHLRRLQTDVSGSHRMAAIARLLDTAEAIGRSLELLRGRSGAIDERPEQLVQLAMESVMVAIPAALQTVAQ